MPNYVRVVWMKGNDRILSTAAEVSQAGDGITIARDYLVDNQTFQDQLFIAWEDFESGYYLADSSEISPPE